jgi:MFS family permease
MTEASPRRDRLVLILLWREACNAFAALGRAQSLALLLAGLALLADQLDSFSHLLRQNAPALRQLPWPWATALGAGLVLAGFIAGLVYTSLSLARAFAPFLNPLPLSLPARRRMVITAVAWLAAATGAAMGAAIGLAAVYVHKPFAAAWGVAAALLFSLGAAFGLWLRLSLTPAARPVGHRHPRKSFAIPGLAWADGARPRWLGSWAADLRGGRLRITAALTFSLAALLPATLLTGGAGLAQHHAAPASIAGVVGGLAVFMLALRCHPLGSPVLRAAPIPYFRAWARLLRLPLIASLLYFAMPACLAVAASPSSWQMPAGGGLCLLALNAAYAADQSPNTPSARARNSPSPPPCSAARRC